MARRLTGEVVIATHNLGKLTEMQELLALHSIAAQSAAELCLPEPIESGTSFQANAEIKALAAAQAAGLPALADDSGLCVAALDGAPGIYSARWAGPAKDFTRAMEKIEAGLRERAAFEPAQRRARFVSALSIGWPDGHVETVVGTIAGVLVWPPRGSRGFGYDPMFLPDGHSLTFGEMTGAQKHGIPADGTLALSHRARAFQWLAARCLGADKPRDPDRHAMP
jgi:XTP/dITP diphosphohydrolase